MHLIHLLLCFALVLGVLLGFGVVLRLHLLHFLLGTLHLPRQFALLLREHLLHFVRRVHLLGLALLLHLFEHIARAFVGGLKRSLQILLPLRLQFLRLFGEFVGFGEGFGLIQAGTVQVLRELSDFAGKFLRLGGGLFLFGGLQNGFADALDLFAGLFQRRCFLFRLRGFQKRRVAQQKQRARDTGKCHRAALQPPETQGIQLSRAHGCRRADGVGGNGMGEGRGCPGKGVRGCEAVGQIATPIHAFAPPVRAVVFP